MTHRPGTIDEAVGQLAMNQKADIVRSAAARVRARLDGEHGRKRDLQALERLAAIEMSALASLYDEIISADSGGPVEMMRHVSKL